MKLENKHIKKIVVILVVVLAFVFIKPLREGITNMSKAFQDLESVKAYIRSFGKTAVIISFLMMILQSVAAPIPAFLITFSNAAIWGWVKGSILSWTSAMAGAALCFGIARFLGRDIAEKFA
ncbi:MAG: TVP38/TMEM64 family protein, partial [Finegoldia magna]|nr:TVP38/TMEM64 family protein [Finegoldia magna]